MDRLEAKQKYNTYSEHATKRETWTLRKLRSKKSFRIYVNNVFGCIVQLMKKKIHPVRSRESLTGTCGGEIDDFAMSRFEVMQFYAALTVATHHCDEASRNSKHPSARGLCMSPGRMELSPQCMLTNLRLRIDCGLQATFPVLLLVPMHAVTQKTLQKERFQVGRRKNGQVLTLE